MFSLPFPVRHLQQQNRRVVSSLPLEWAAHLPWYFFPPTFTVPILVRVFFFFLKLQKLFFHVSSSGNCFHSDKKNNTDSKTLRNSSSSICPRGAIYDFLKALVKTMIIFSPFFPQTTLAPPSLPTTLRRIASLPITSRCWLMRGTRWSLPPRDKHCSEATREKSNPCRRCLIPRSSCRTRPRTARWSFLPATGGAFCLRAARSLWSGARPGISVKWITPTRRSRCRRTTLESLRWPFPGLEEKTDWQAEQPLPGLFTGKTTSRWWTLSRPDSHFLPQALLPTAAAAQPAPLTNRKSLPAPPSSRRNPPLCPGLRPRTTGLPEFLPGRPSFRRARRAPQVPWASRFTSTASCLPRRVLQPTPIMWAGCCRGSTVRGRHPHRSAPPASSPSWRTAGRPAARTTFCCRRAKGRPRTDERDSWVNRRGWGAAAASGRTND